MLDSLNRLDRKLRQLEKWLPPKKQEPQARPEFPDFFRGAWEILEPHRTLIWNWHLELLCDCLTAVSQRQIRWLLINIGPRHLKSRIATMAWPCWDWLEFPWYRWLFLSYISSLANDHSQDRRKIIQSDYYQTLSGGMTLSSSKNRISEFENDSNGVMLARGLDSGVTGSGGDRIVVDDPNDPEKMESPEICDRTLRRFKDYTTTRQDDPQNTSVVVIQQRTGDGDVSGYVLKELADDYYHLCLPTVAEKEQTIYFPFSDRMVTRKPGELLHPERFGQEEADRSLRVLGSRVFAARHQQDPAPSAGGLFEIRWFGFYCYLPPDSHRQLISVDASFRDSPTSDRVAISAIAENRKENENDYYLFDETCEQLSFTRTIEALQVMVERYPWAYTKLVETKANGDAICDTLEDNVPGIERCDPGRDSKQSRAAAIAPIIERVGLLLPLAQWAIPLLPPGQLTISAGEWWILNPPPEQTVEHLPCDRKWQQHIKEWISFPNGQYDDRIDSVGQAIRWCESKRKEEEGQHEEEDYSSIESFVARRRSYR